MRNKLSLLIFIPILIITRTMAQGCNDCEPGYTPGTGSITASYTYREFVSIGADCTLVQCITINLSGSQATDGLKTFAGVSVPASGTIVHSDNSCCNSFAPTVYPIDGDIIGSMGGVAVIAYWRADINNPAVEIVTLQGGTATCTTLSINETTFGDNVQIIENCTMSFTGGACEEDNPPGTDPPDPPDPTDPPDPNTPGGGPTAPDPDYPDPPNNPDDPPGPDDPPPPVDPTEPGGGDPNNPDPDPDDACCAAITARLDTLILWADYNTGWNENTFLTLELMRADMFQFMYDLMYGQDTGDGAPGILQINNRQNAEMLAQLQMGNLWREHFNEYFSDQTWYLKQIYEQGFEDGTYTTLENSDGFTPTDGTTKMQGMYATAKAAALEHGQDFKLPDLTPYDDDANAPVLVIPISLVGGAIGMEIDDVSVDFTPYTTVRDLFHVATLILVGVNAIFIVWAELKKQ